jgi:hypothetical protein
MKLIKIKDSAIIEMNHNLHYVLCAKKTEEGWEVKAYIRTKEHALKLVELLGQEKIAKFELAERSAIVAKKILSNNSISFEEFTIKSWEFKEFTDANITGTERFIG